MSVRNGDFWLEVTQQEETAREY